ESHLQEIVAITSDLDSIWGKCEGYSGAPTFTQFIMRHRVVPAAYYVAFRDETAASIKQAVSLRFDAPFDERDTSALNETAQTVFGATTRLLRALPIVLDVPRAVWRFGLGNVVTATTQMIAGLNRYTLVRWLNAITHNAMPPLESHYSSVVP